MVLMESPVLKLIFDIGMVIGPVIGYGYQYLLIRRRQSIGTFSIDICGILLFANITRLNFYLFKQYQFALFLQSCVMISVQILLLHICKTLPIEKTESPQDVIDQQSNRTYLGGFWRWPKFFHYAAFIITFSSFLLVLSLFMSMVDITGLYGQALGIIALGSQAILILPQIIRNCKQKLVKGVSHLLLSLNLIGDILKLIYFILALQPFQFWMCGITQVVLDGFAIFQIFLYRKNRTQQEQPPIQLDDNLEKQDKKSEAQVKQPEIKTQSIMSENNKKNDEVETEAQPNPPQQLG